MRLSMTRWDGVTENETNNNRSKWRKRHNMSTRSWKPSGGLVDCNEGLKKTNTRAIWWCGACRPSPGGSILGRVNGPMNLYFIFYYLFYWRVLTYFIISRHLCITKTKKNLFVWRYYLYKMTNICILLYVDLILIHWSNSPTIIQILLQNRGGWPAVCQMNGQNWDTAWPEVSFNKQSTVNVKIPSWKPMVSMIPLSNT